MKLAGFDVGTTGLKGMVVDESGHIIAESSVPYTPSSPRPGWSEQAPEDWWDAFCVCAATLTAEVGTPDAIGLSGQMHGSVFLDSKDQPVSSAILWNDQRTVDECDEILERTEGRALEWTLNEPRTAFTASKMLWLRNKFPERFEQVATVLLPKDYVRYCLTGERLTDVTDASGTHLLDVRNRDWSSEMLTALDISRTLLPGVVESAAEAGHSRHGCSALAGGIPLVGGGADQACAAIGNGIVREGSLSITIGTSGVVYAQLPGVDVDGTGAFHTFCHAMPNTWMAMAGVLSAGGSFQWYRDTVGAIDAQRAKVEGVSSFDAVVSSTADVPAGSDGLIFLPYLTGERSPHNDPAARGAWIGLTARHGRGHMAKAVIEGVCFALRDLVEIIEQMGVSITEVRVAGGGARATIWLQTLASVIGRQVVATRTPDASAYGASIIAMAQLTGSSVADVADTWVHTDSPIEPEVTANRIYDEVYGVFCSLYPANRAAMHRLSSIEQKTLTG